jgi:hypothetical protein
MQTVDLITPHPALPDYTRKAVIKRTLSYHDEKYSLLVVEVQHYLNGVLENSPTGIVRNITVELRADNSVFVNPGTGEYVPADTPGAMPEYDYIDYLETQNLPFSNQHFKQTVVLRAEQQGRFDV